MSKYETRAEAEREGQKVPKGAYNKIRRAKREFVEGGAGEELLTESERLELVQRREVVPAVQLLERKLKCFILFLFLQG